MFISQVIFEADLEHKEMMRDLMRHKQAAIAAAEAVIDSEGWWKEDSRQAGFAVVGKWPSKEEFQAWLIAIHPNGHKKRAEGAPEIRKTMNRFEMVE